MGSDLVKTGVKSPRFGVQLKQAYKDAYSVPRSSLFDEVRGAGRFVSLFDRQWVSLMREKIEPGMLAVSTVFAGPGGAWGGFALTGDTFWAFGSMLVTTASFLGMSMYLSKKRDKVLLSLVDINHNLVVGWLRDVYGEHFSRETTGRMAYAITVNGTLDDTFVAESGRLYNLSCHAAPADAQQRIYYLVEQQAVVAITTGEVEGQSVLTAIPESVVSVAEQASLPLSIQGLVESLNSRLERLSEFDLSVDEAHDVKRIQQDARQALTTFQRLVKLADAEFSVKGEQNVAEVFAILNEEARLMVGSVASGLNSDLLAQKGYLRSRHALKSSSSELMLGSVVSPAEAEESKATAGVK